MIKQTQEQNKNRNPKLERTFIFKEMKEGKR